MSGGKGGSTTSSVEIPEYIERAAQENLNRAQAIAQMGYVPYYGPDVAAFTPMQEAAMQNVASAAGAFGLATPTGASVTGMPTATEYAGGIRGYSSAPLFEQAQAELARRRPAQKSYIDSFFIDPVTGTYGANAPALIDYTAYGTGGGTGGGGSSSGGRDPYGGGDSVSDFLDPNNRMGMAEHMARQKRNFAAGVTPDPNFGYGVDDKGGVVAIGYGPGQVDPALANAAGYTRRVDKNPFDMTFGEHMGAMAGDVKNIASRVASDVSKISPLANIISAVSKPKPTAIVRRPRPDTNDNNDSRISLPKPTKTKKKTKKSHPGKSASTGKPKRMSAKKAKTFSRVNRGR
jgi:hypothetical protein